MDKTWYDQICKLVQKHYGLSVTVKQLAGDIDLNFLIQDKQGTQYILKIMHEVCDENIIDLQCQTLQHIQQKDIDINLPQSIKTISKNSYEIVHFNESERLMWLLSYCPGVLYADVKPKTQKLAFSFGQAMAKMRTSLKDFDHQHKIRDHKWELTQALQVKDLASHITGETSRIVKDIYSKFESIYQLKLLQLPHMVIHNDANDYNVLVQFDADGLPYVSGLFDFGDMAFQPAICDVAIALAYAILDQDKPLEICDAFLRGYTEFHKLKPDEIFMLFHLIQLRLAVSLSVSSHRQLSDDDPYIVISQEPAKKCLTLLSQYSEAFVTSYFRYSAQLPIVDRLPNIHTYLKNKITYKISPIETDDFTCILDLSVGSLLLGSNPKSIELETLTKKINEEMKVHNVSFSFGRYNESRRLYQSNLFTDHTHPVAQSRTNHLGLDIFCKEGVPVRAPLDGMVYLKAINKAHLDYGPLVILEHSTDQNEIFYTLYGHLKTTSIESLKVGQKIKKGEVFSSVGAPFENVGWPPHLHFQIIIDLLDLAQNFPGVAFESEAAFWHQLSPNPCLLLPIDNSDDFDAGIDRINLLPKRKKYTGGNLSLSYKKPIHAVNGFKQFLYDSHARAYLDVYNNVPHVGHSHPKVVEAINKQTALLNTNTRYLHQNYVNYAERLTSRLPENLEVCYFVNSATEANELAMRLARTYTGKYDMMVVDHAYHGHTTSLIDISPYKHNGPGGSGPPNWVHTIGLADDYRGVYKRTDQKAGIKYANELKQKFDSLENDNIYVAGFIAETYPSVGGQIIPPPDYLKNCYDHIRNHGALCIADEVQTGFGRLGNSFWAFETQEAIPDIVILGKPIANGFPMGAVVTTRVIADAFDNGMEYFSTFGGNPVACAAASAVLDVIEEEYLQENATILGDYFKSSLLEMKERFPIIGDVRGEGFYLGIELVRNRETLEPADQETRYFVNRLKAHFILAGVDGPLHNVIKIRPSMVVNKSDMDYLIETIESIFQENYMQL